MINYLNYSIIHFYLKDLHQVNKDLGSVFILDNSPGAYRHYTENAIPIKSWFSVSSSHV